MKFYVLCVLGLLLTHQQVHAATIERLAANGEIVVLKLTAAEAEEFAEGEVITIRTRNAGEPIEGQIRKIKNGKAFVKVSGTKGFETGKTAEVAAIGGAGFIKDMETSSVSQEESRAGFRESVYNPFQVSPAQIYQVRGFRTDVQLSLLNDDWSYKVASIDAKLSQTGPTISAAAIKRVSPHSNLLFGMTLERQQYDLRFELETGFNFVDESGSVATNRAAPMVAYSSDHFTVAAEYGVRQTRYDGDYFAADHS